MLVDFNVDALCNEACAGVESVLTEHVLMFTEPTHLDGGGLLDHAYLRKQLLMRKYVNSKGNIMYFSDHNAVKTHIQKKEELEDDQEIDFTVS